MNKTIAWTLLALMACDDTTGMDDSDPGASDTAQTEDTDDTIDRPVYPGPSASEFSYWIAEAPLSLGIDTTPSGGHVLLQDARGLSASAIFDVFTGEVTDLTRPNGVLGYTITDDGAMVGGNLGKNDTSRPATWTAGEGWSTVEGGFVDGCGGDSIYANDGTGTIFAGLGVEPSEEFACDFFPAVWEGKARIPTQVEGRINAMLPDRTAYGFMNAGGMSNRSPMWMDKWGDAHLIAGDATGEFSAIRSDGLAAGQLLDEEIGVWNGFLWTMEGGLEDLGPWPAEPGFWNLNVLDICRPDMVIGFNMYLGLPNDQRTSMNFQGEWFWFDEFLAEQGLSTDDWRLMSLNSCSEDGEVISGSAMNLDGETRAIVLQFPDGFWDELAAN